MSTVHRVPPLALAAVGLALLGGCSLPPASDPIEGPVVGREHHEATTTSSVILLNGTFIPTTDVVPERWTLVVEDEHGRGRVEVSVSEDIYSAPPAYWRQGQWIDPSVQADPETLDQ